VAPAVRAKKKKEKEKRERMGNVAHGLQAS
jgi:hypothetical protein